MREKIIAGLKRIDYKILTANTMTLFAQAVYMAHRRHSHSAEIEVTPEIVQNTNSSR